MLLKFGRRVVPNFPSILKRRPRLLSRYPYINFMRTYKRTHPRYSFAKVMKRGADAWKKLSPEKQRIFKQKNFIKKYSKLMPPTKFQNFSVAAPQLNKSCNQSVKRRVINAKKPKKPTRSKNKFKAKVLKGRKPKKITSKGKKYRFSTLKSKNKREPRTSLRYCSKARFIKNGSKKRNLACKPQLAKKNQPMNIVLTVKLPVHAHFSPGDN